MNSKYKKLKLGWPGKDLEIKPEPRVLIEDPEKSYGETNKENMLINAIKYCKTASEINKPHNEKAWKYAIIPHDKTDANMTFMRFVTEYGR